MLTPQLTLGKLVLATTLALTVSCSQPPGPPTPEPFALEAGVTSPNVIAGASLGLGLSARGGTDQERAAIGRPSWQSGHGRLTDLDGWHTRFRPDVPAGNTAAVTATSVVLGMPHSVTAAFNVVGARAATELSRRPLDEAIRTWAPLPVVAGDHLYVSWGVFGDDVSGARIEVRRYDLDGQLDVGFGDSGSLRFPTNDLIVSNNWHRILAASDGQVLFVTIEGSSIVLRKLDRSGVPVSNFGSGGTAVLTARCEVPFPRFSLDAEDTLFVDHGCLSAEGSSQVTKVLANGAADSGFSGDGVYDVPRGFHVERLQAEGGHLYLLGEFVSPVVGGSTISGNVAGMVRLNPFGRPDTTFGSDGQLMLVGDRSDPRLQGHVRDTFLGLERLPDGRLLAYGRRADVLHYRDEEAYDGYGYVDTQAAFAVRLSDRGALDSSFGDGGVASIQLFEDQDSSSSVDVVLTLTDGGFRVGQSMWGRFRSADFDWSGQVVAATRADLDTFVPISGVPYNPPVTIYLARLLSDDSILLVSQDCVGSMPTYCTTSLRHLVP